MKAENTKIRPNAECSILLDVCPHFEEENPCEGCGLFKEYKKYKKLAEDYWKKERIEEEILIEAEEYENDLAF